MTVEHPRQKSEQLPVVESANRLKDQLRAVWEQIPDEAKATLAVELLKDLEERERLSFRVAFDTRWPIASESVPATFALISISPDDLAQIGLVEEEIERFDDDKLRQMSTDIRDHYVAHGFWEELKYHTAHFLGGLRKPNQK